MKKDAATAPNTTTDPVFRLTEMIVEEVSAVDRAANLRTFLIVKSATGSATPTGEVVRSATGELTVAKAPDVPTSTTPPAPASAPMPTSPEAPPIPSATNTEAAPLGTPLRLSPEVKAELGKRLADAAAQLAKLTAAVSGAEEVQGLVEVPQDVLEGVTGIVTALSAGVTKAAVEKGRKQISMARETKIRAAHKELSDLVAELDAQPEPEVVEEAAPAAAPAAPAAAAAPAPAAPAAKAVVSKADHVLAGVVGLVEKLTKANAAQAVRLDAIERARPVSNAATVEASPVAVTKSDDDEPKWPADMNSGARNGASTDGDFASR